MSHFLKMSCDNRHGFWRSRPFLLPILCLVTGQLLTFRPAFAEDAKTAATEELRHEDCEFVAEVDGAKEHYVLIYPKEFSPEKPVSLLFALHGHGSDRWQFVKQSRGETQAARDVAAAHGLLFVSPDYRAKTSWMGPKAEADMVQIVAELKKRFKVDKTILLGASMGGTSVLTFTALHPDLVDGVVSINGTADLEHYERFLDAIAASYGGTKTEKPEEYHRRSAVNFPEKFNMPLATTTGGKDTVVPPDSVLKLVEAVKKHNPNVLSLHRPEGGHSTNYQDTTEALEFVLGKIKAAK